MPHRFKNTDRHTPLLPPPDLRLSVAEDDRVHFVIQAVERLPLCAFAIPPKGWGDQQYPPHMMLALLSYRYARQGERNPDTRLPVCVPVVPSKCARSGLPRQGGIDRARRRGSCCGP